GYIERLLSGGRDVALVLLPRLNDLRRVRGRPLLTEGSLLLLPGGGSLTTRAAARWGSASSVPAAGSGFRRAAIKLRPAFQTALLGWIRGEKPIENTRELMRVAEMLEAAAATEAVKQLWHVLGGLLFAFQ